VHIDSAAKVAVAEEEASAEAVAALQLVLHNSGKICLELYTVLHNFYNTFYSSFLLI
jgi:Na+-translocating ferredoxin:NAD+ oxidoreductase RnfC subunit